MAIGFMAILPYCHKGILSYRYMALKLFHVGFYKELNNKMYQFSQGLSCENDSKNISQIKSKSPLPLKFFSDVRIHDKVL